MKQSINIRVRNRASVSGLVLGMIMGLLVIVPALAQENLGVQNGRAVSLELTVKRQSDNSVAFSNVDKEPVTYVHGQRQLIPGLETALEGMKAGESKSVNLSADQAYGPYDEQKKVTVQRDKLPGDVEVGTTVQSSDGHMATVKELTEKEAVLDFNHPMAGEDLLINVKVLSVQKKPEQAAHPE